MQIPYLLLKDGLWYAHNRSGYVSRPELAEIFDKEHALAYARSHNDVLAIPATEIFDDAQSVQEYIDRLVAIRDCLASSGCEVTGASDNALTRDKGSA